MPKNRNKNKNRGGGAGGRGGGGRGRGGGRGSLADDSRQPVGNQVVVQGKHQKNKRGRGRGGGHASARAQRQSGGKNTKSGGIILEQPKEEVREDGIFKHQEIKKAHTDAITCICITEDCIYTGSRDKTLKRWKVGKGVSGRFELTPEIEVPLGEACICMVNVGDWFFCGLGNGSIKGFSKVGKETTLQGHAKRCQALKVHEVVLLSGGSDGVVKCWQMNPATQEFACTHSIQDGIAGSAACMEVLGEHLWVGGSSGVAIVELATLRVIHQLPQKKFVGGFLLFQDHMIVAFADGSTCIYDKTGNEKRADPPMAAGPILSMAGLPVGPRMLCGHAKGHISSVKLPSFEVVKYWQANDRCKVQSLVCTQGQEGIFIAGGENGALQLWQKDPSFVVP